MSKAKNNIGYYKAKGLIPHPERMLETLSNRLKGMEYVELEHWYVEVCLKNTYSDPAARCLRDYNIVSKSGKLILVEKLIEEAFYVIKNQKTLNHGPFSRDLLLSIGVTSMSNDNYRYAGAVLRMAAFYEKQIYYVSDTRDVGKGRRKGWGIYKQYKNMDVNWFKDNFWRQMTRKDKEIFDAYKAKTNADKELEATRRNSLEFSKNNILESNIDKGFFNGL